MKRLFLLLLPLLIASCVQEKPLITNPDRLSDINKMLKVQKELTSNAQLPIWNILENPASENEGQAMQFLYAYMPLSDLADYPPQFMQANVRQSLEARKDAPWGKIIPEDEFLHFVLPLRVNNENLDSFRLVYYAEIKARIAGLPMKEAALEINHWCHEKVNYRGTDSRTSAPMSTIRKSFGRCGEESTFTVTAMRTAGIPARQVYTPRWAHTDDNHAWVEVWIDGKWHYMGACEPDAELDRGWFSEPAQRTMLVHTRCYGRYFGKEEVLDTQGRFSELNLTTNYARTKKVTVAVKDENNQPVSGAKVEFKLYNYAEFYPLATLLTNNNGTANFTTGMGDLLVWASHQDKFAFQQLHVASTDTLMITLTSKELPANVQNYDLVPPQVANALLPLPETVRKHNDERLAREDAIRNKYISTFKDSAWILNYANDHHLPADTLLRVVRLSYGNWQELINYLDNNVQVNRKNLLTLLFGISDKDLSDTKAAILTDHLQTTRPLGQLSGISKTIFEQYVLAPRIDLELLTNWRGFLQTKLEAGMAEKAQKDISVLTHWINTNIRIDPVANKHSRAPLTPVGVYNVRVADPLSRDIFFVAACRTFGIPARLNPETRIPEYFKENKWYRAGFESKSSQPEIGFLTIQLPEQETMPQYSIHFTIARIEAGVAKSLEFEEGRAAKDFQKEIPLETGKYLLINGKRISNGAVLSTVTGFEITKNQKTAIGLQLRREVNTLKSMGRMDTGSIHLTDIGSGATGLFSNLQSGKNVALMLLDPNNEPSRHLLHDLTPYLKQFNVWDGVFIFVANREKARETKIFTIYQLPNHSRLAEDSNQELEKAIASINNSKQPITLPVVFLVSASGELYPVSSGYTIGIGETLLNQLKTLKSTSATLPVSQCTSN